MYIHKPDFIIRILIRIASIILSVPIGIVTQGLRARGRPDPGRDDWVEVTAIEIQLNNLDPTFDGYRVAQLSDFHMGTWLTRDLLSQAVDLVNQNQPDLVAITGDFVTYNPEYYINDLVEPLKRLNPKDGTVAVLGNHDHWSNPRVIRDIMRRADIIDLSNDVHQISRGRAKLFVAGIDSYSDHQNNFEAVTRKIPASNQTILLAHEPDFADISACLGKFDLQLSGHSHGGQIRFPLIGAPILPKHARKYPIGLYQVKDMILYTNRGLGMAELPLRWNCPPEITIITLRRS